jgi:phospholipid/cholesterol/gamma-HCH transport system substrate-binding protein
MDDRIMQFRVGVVVLGVFLIAGFMTLLFNHFQVKSYTIYIDFASANGIAAGTPIKSSGVLIGRVVAVKLQTDKPDQPVRVTAEIDSEYKILHNQTLQLTSGLLGDSELDVVTIPSKPQSPPPVVEPSTPPETPVRPTTSGEPSLRAITVAQLQAVPPPPAPPATPVQPGETIQGAVGANPTQEFAKLETDMSTVSKSLSAAGDEVRQLAHNINGMIGNGDSDRLKRLVDKTEASMDAMQRTLNDVDKIVGDPQMQSNMKKSLNDLPETLHQMQQSFVAIQKTTALADENLKNLEGVTRPLSEQGEQMIHHAHQSIRELDELLGQMAQFSRALNGSQGTLGQLINSPELYQQLTDAASNINDLTHRLQPILNDVRDFTDKIARHPEVLGVRGAIDRSPGIK